MLRQNDNQIRQSARLAIVSIAVLAGFLCLLGGCNKKTTDDRQRFHLKGKIVSVNPQEEIVTVNHEAIPGFMGTMTMPYPVSDKKDLARVAAGDEITADIVMDSGVPLIENITVTKKGAGEKEQAKP